MRARNLSQLELDPRTAMTAAEIVICTLAVALAAVSFAVSPQTHVGPDVPAAIALRDGYLSDALFALTTAAVLQALKDVFYRKGELSLALPLVFAGAILLAGACFLSVQGNASAKEADEPPSVSTVSYIGEAAPWLPTPSSLVFGSRRLVFETGEGVKMSFDVTSQDLSDGGAVSNMGLESGKLYQIEYYPRSSCLSGATGPLEEA